MADLPTGSQARQNPTTVHYPPRSRLSTFLQPFFSRLRAFIHSPPASHCLYGDFPPDKTPLSFSVKIWTSLLQGYDRKVASSTAVSRVEYREASESSAGNYLLLEVTSPPTGATVLVKIDRFQWTDDDDEGGPTIDLPFHNRVTARPEEVEMGVESDTEKIVGSLDFRQSDAPPSVLWITYLLAAADDIYEQRERNSSNDVLTPCLLHRSLVSPSQSVQGALQSDVERQTSSFSGETELSIRKELLHHIQDYTGQGLEMFPDRLLWDDVDAMVPELLVAAAIRCCKTSQRSQ